MNRLLQLPVAALIAVLQSLPLPWVAGLGRATGSLFWWGAVRQRTRALSNLELAFGDLRSATELRAIARENFRRRGETWLCSLKTAGMRREELQPHLQVVGLGKLRPWLQSPTVRGIVIAIGHFGNPELYSHVSHELPLLRAITRYRPGGRRLTARILKQIHSGSACSFFEAGREDEQFRKVVRNGNVVVGLMCDEDAGPNGLSIPFFGRPCSTSPAVATIARRYQMPLFGAVCFRTGPGRWRLEISDEIPTTEHGKPRRMDAVMKDVNAHLEAAILRDPANWFWAQPRWANKGRPARMRPARS